MVGARGLGGRVVEVVVRVDNCMRQRVPNMDNEGRDAMENSMMRRVEDGEQLSEKEKNEEKEVTCARLK